MAAKTKRFMANNSWGFRFILTIKCCFSKYMWLFPLVRKEAVGVYYATKYLFEKEGYLEIFQSDNGKEFVATIIKNFLKDNGVEIKHGRPRHPQSQGQVENLNKTVKGHMKRLLYKSTNETKANLWPMLLPGIASIINNNYHHTIDDIPFRVYHNREPASMKHHIIPDDLNWINENNKVDLNGMESSGDDADSSTDSENETVQT